MNIRDLQYFIAVAELGHFGQAAARCCVSQPTLSGQIKKLEAELGVTLFERTNRRVMLTDTGNQIANSARRILREVDTIHDMAQSRHDPLAGKFRLGAFPTLATYIFPELVPKVKKHLPNLRLILIEEKTAILTDQLKRGKIDAALLALPVDDNFLVSQPLFEDEFLLAVSPGHELAAYKSVDQKKLEKHRLLLLEEGHCLRDQALEVCQLNGVAEEEDFRATGLETLRQMVKAGTGITFMPQIAIKNDEPGIRYIPFSGQPPVRTIGLVWRKTSARRQVIDKFVEILIDPKARRTLRVVR
ncbi:MAG: LysR family transcriptional regulator [Gammaproteobacteria bacterium]|nr:LysR family transcriptional regulator [Gammaproteobacteria bacterium]